MDSFGTRDALTVGGQKVAFHRLGGLKDTLRLPGGVQRLPYSIRVLLENLLRNEDGDTVTRGDIEAVARWNPKDAPSTEIAFRPARVLLQDFTGVPAVVDLAAMRESFQSMGGDASRINPLQPVDLVIDHSVQVDSYGTLRSFQENVELEFQRNQERYQFLKWGQQAFDNMRVVPPGTGIVHQVNLEYLAHVVFQRKDSDGVMAYPDSLVGTDSHTTMINGLGVLGWGVGGIEAEAAMLGQPITMLVPQVVGFRLRGAMPEGATATDLVLTVTEMLRGHGVVGKFVEFFGDGLASLSLPDRATIANMAPEYGATMGFFPVDEQTLRYLKFSGRSDDEVDVVRAVTTAQGLFHTADQPEPEFSAVLELDLSQVVPSLAGPKRPQDRVALSDMQSSWRNTFEGLNVGGPGARASVENRGHQFELQHGAVVIAAITSCTNTSNPAVMLGAGLLAKKAQARGLMVKPWVKTSLAPGSQVVTEYLKEADVLGDLEALGFHLVGYGCTTCIGNSGPLDAPIVEGIQSQNLAVASVLSGNRNFEGRVSPHTRANYLASPPLVVAYALAGSVDLDLQTDPLGQDRDGKDVFLRDVWPSTQEISDTVAKAVKTAHFRERYAHVLEGTEEWARVEVPSGNTFAWSDASTYIRKPSFFDGVKAGDPPAVQSLQGARVLALLEDSVTTDHISPAGAIASDSPAARYLRERGVSPRDFNSYGSRRGNHEVMMRGTFANIRLRNQLVPGVEGGVTRHIPTGETMSIFDASQKYQQEGTSLVVLAGKEYGTGSSRDWAAKGTLLLGVRAVIAQSFERIHRSNLIGMGVLPLQFASGDSWKSLGLTGEETFDIAVGKDLAPGMQLTVTASSGKTFTAIARLDTPREVDYYRHGGILSYVLRNLAS